MTHTPDELRKATEAVWRNRYGHGEDRSTPDEVDAEIATAVLDAVLPDHDRRVLAEYRHRLAERLAITLSDEQLEAAAALAAPVEQEAHNREQRVFVAACGCREVWKYVYTDEYGPRCRRVAAPVEQEAP